MTRRLRLLLLAVASLGALALSSSALAAFTPQLAVSNSPMATNATGTTTIRLTVPTNDDALFRADMYVPTGYEAPLNQSFGAQVGTVTARVRVQTPIPDLVVPLNGTITAQDPASLANNQCSPGMHAAVWLLVLNVPGGDPFRVPVYVDPTTGTETALGRYRLRVCLASPHVPPPIGAAQGARVVRADLTLNQVFRTPATSGEYLWRVIATPWAPPVTPNIAATVEARSTIGFPGALSVAATSRNRTLTVTGRLVEGPAGVSSGNVVVRVGRKAYRVRTNATGRYTLRVKFRRAGTTTVRATAAVGVRTTTCDGPSAAPAGCVTHTRAFFTVTSRTLRARVR